MPVTAELENINKLEIVGFSHEQAKVLAEIHETSVQAHDESLKDYLDQKFKEIRSEFKEARTEIKTSEQRLETKIADSKSELLKANSDLLVKIFGIVFGSISIAVAILKLIL